MDIPSEALRWGGRRPLGSKAQGESDLRESPRTKRCEAVTGLNQVLAPILQVGAMAPSSFVTESARGPQTLSLLMAHSSCRES